MSFTDNLKKSHIMWVGLSAKKVNDINKAIPLENNTEWMDKLADRINSRNNTGSKIVLMIDGKELGWATINNINSITKQTGNLQLQII